MSDSRRSDDAALHVLMVTDFYWPLLGGVEQHVRTLAHELVRTGHRVTVVTLRSDDSPERERDHGADVVRIRSGTQRIPALFDQSRPWAPPVADPVARRALRRVIDEVRPDVIHGHDWLARSVPHGDVPVVSSQHYYTLSCARKDLLRDGEPCSGPSLRRCTPCASRHYGIVKGPVVAATAAVGRRHELAAVAHVIAVSTATARGNGLTVTGLDAPDDTVPCSVIPNFLPPTVGADDARGGATDGAVDREVDVEPLLAKLPAEPFVAYVGDFRSVKGFDLLLEAYERAGIGRQLVAVGKRWPSSPTEVPDGVHLHENWPNVAVRRMFERAHVTVVPSLWAEPFGIVAIEAMAAGTPVVAAGHGGLVDIVDHGATGLLVEPGDADAFADALRRLEREPELVGRLGDAARSAAERYRAERVVPRIVEVYRHVLAADRRRPGRRTP
ncbi:MAG: glycosyltransferase family 4 protein [Actinomycetota bacterium]